MALRTYEKGGVFKERSGIIKNDEYVETTVNALMGEYEVVLGEKNSWDIDRVKVTTENGQPIILMYRKNSPNFVLGIQANSCKGAGKSLMCEEGDRDGYHKYWFWEKTGTFKEKYPVGDFYLNFQIISGFETTNRLHLSKIK